MALITDDDYKVPLGLRPTQPKSYTLAKIEELAREYVKEHDNGNKLTRELVMSSWLYWLETRQKREKESVDV